MSLSSLRSALVSKAEESRGTRASPSEKGTFALRASVINLIVAQKVFNFSRLLSPLRSTDIKIPLALFHEFRNALIMESTTSDKSLNDKKEVSFSNPQEWSQAVKDRSMKSGMGHIILNAVGGKKDE